MNDFEKLLNSLLKPPGMRVLHFTNKDTLIKELQNFCDNNEVKSEYLIATFNKDSLQNLKNYENDFTRATFMPIKKPRYNAQNIQYDYIFLDMTLENYEEFFKKVYSAIRNSGLMFIFLDSNNKNLAYRLEQELIDSNYVAVNISNIDDFLIVSGKKMHGWSSK